MKKWWASKDENYKEGVYTILMIILLYILAGELYYLSFYIWPAGTLGP